MLSEVLPGPAMLVPRICGRNGDTGEFAFGSKGKLGVFFSPRGCFLCGVCSSGSGISSIVSGGRGVSLSRSRICSTVSVMPGSPRKVAPGMADSGFFWLPANDVKPNRNRSVEPAQRETEIAVLVRVMMKLLWLAS